MNWKAGDYDPIGDIRAAIDEMAKLSKPPVYVHGDVYVNGARIGRMTVQEFAQFSFLAGRYGLVIEVKNV